MLGKLVLKLMETFGESLVADPWELIKFCSLILVNSINNSGSSDDDGISASSSSPSSSTIPCLNIVNNGGADINTHSTANGVNSVNSNDDGDDDDYDSRPSSMLIMTLGLLSIVFSKDVEDVPRNPNAETLTANLLVQLQTLVESSSSKSTISEKECADIKMLAIDLKMQLSAFISNMRLLYGSPSSSTEPSPQWLAAEMARLRQSLDEAVADTKDPLIPVRAFGLSQIRQLILTSASSIIKQQEQNSSSAVTAAASSVITPRLPAILALHLDHIHDNDSFIYLNAIKGLAALTDVYPRQTLLYISNRYATSSDGTTSAASSMGLDYRLRLGEVLLLTVQRCGPALRKYGNQDALPQQLFVRFGLTTLLLSL